MNGANRLDCGEVLLVAKSVGVTTIVTIVKCKINKAAHWWLQSLHRILLGEFSKQEVFIIQSAILRLTYIGHLVVLDIHLVVFCGHFLPIIVDILVYHAKNILLDKPGVLFLHLLFNFPFFFKTSCRILKTLHTNGVEVVANK